MFSCHVSVDVFTLALSAASPHFALPRSGHAWKALGACVAMTWKLCAIGTAEQTWVPEKKKEEKKEEATPRGAGWSDSGSWGKEEATPRGSGWSDSGSWGKEEKDQWDSRDHGEGGGGGGSRKRRRGGGGGGGGGGKGWPSSRPVAPRADEAMRSIQVMMLNCRVSIAC